MSSISKNLQQPHPPKKTGRGRKKNAAKRQHQELMDAVDGLPALLMDEARQQRFSTTPQPKTLPRLHPSAHFDPKKEQAKNRILIASVAFLASIVLGMWFLTATNTIHLWKEQPSNTFAFFEGSKKQLTEVFNNTNDSNYLAVEAAMQAALDEVQQQQATEAAVAAELQNLLAPAAIANTSTPAENSALATSSDDVILSAQDQNE